MEKKILLAIFVFAASSLGFANRNDASSEITNVISNYYKNDSMSLNVKENFKKTNDLENGKATVKSDVRDKIISYAKTKLGSPYVWGAVGPSTFDCSGFVGYVYKNSAGLSLPRVSKDQATFKPKISSMSMKKGDLIFFETTGKGVISHVGIYMGDRQFIHASSGGKKVMVSSLDSGYYSKAFRWAINPFN